MWLVWRVLPWWRRVDLVWLTQIRWQLNTSVVVTLRLMRNMLKLLWWWLLLVMNLLMVMLICRTDRAFTWYGPRENAAKSWGRPGVASRRGVGSSVEI